MTKQLYGKYKKAERLVYWFKIPISIHNCLFQGIRAKIAILPPFPAGKSARSASMCLEDFLSVSKPILRFFQLPDY